jgi:hypothetical protein
MKTAENLIALWRENEMMQYSGYRTGGQENPAQLNMLMIYFLK